MKEVDNNHQIYNYKCEIKALKKDFKKGEIDDKEYKKQVKELENKIQECKIDAKEALEFNEEDEEI